MRDDQYSKSWLKRVGPTGRPLGNEDVAINCFPYGLTGISDDTVDLIDALKPAYVRFIYWLILNLMLSALGLTLAYLISGRHTGAGTYALYIFSALISPFVFSKFMGKAANKPIQEYIATRLFKLVALNATPKTLQLILKKQPMISIPWTALDSIKLVQPARGGKATVVFDGPSMIKPMIISLSSLHTHENWIVLSHAIANFAPHIEIDPAIARALTLQSVETSFTEIWLDSLTLPPEQASLELIPEGEKLNNDRYVVRKKLASGGQGQAYLALDTTTNEEVVIKSYLLPVYQGKRVRDNAVQQLESESVVLQRISHPHIVHFIDWFCQSHRAYLVLNNIEGKNLRQWLKAHGIPDAALITDLARQMCEILGYLHSFKPPIVHRDFTPDNLIIDDSAKLTLIDFTIAEPTGAISGLPPVGQPAYMPPEQFRGETGVESDIYALGGTLQFLITGEDPVALEQTDLRTTHPSVPVPLVEIVYKCRAQDARERYQSVALIKEQLTL